MSKKKDAALREFSLPASKEWSRRVIPKYDEMADRALRRLVEEAYRTGFKHGDRTGFRRGVEVGKAAVTKP